MTITTRASTRKQTQQAYSRSPLGNRWLSRRYSRQVIENNHQRLELKYLEEQNKALKSKIDSLRDCLAEVEDQLYSPFTVHLEQNYISSELRLAVKRDTYWDPGAPLVPPERASARTSTARASALKEWINCLLNQSGIIVNSGALGFTGYPEATAHLRRITAADELVKNLFKDSSDEEGESEEESDCESGTRWESSPRERAVKPPQCDLFGTPDSSDDESAGGRLATLPHRPPTPPRPSPDIFREVSPNY